MKKIIKTLTWSNDAVVVQLVVDGVPHAQASVTMRLLKNFLLLRLINDHLNSGNFFILTILKFGFHIEFGFQIEFSIPMVSLCVLCPINQTDHSNKGTVNQITRWHPFVQLSNGWAVRYLNGIQIPDHLASNQFSTI